MAVGPRGFVVGGNAFFYAPDAAAAAAAAAAPGASWLGTERGEILGTRLAGSQGQRRGALRWVYNLVREALSFSTGRPRRALKWSTLLLENGAPSGIARFFLRRRR